VIVGGVEMMSRVPMKSNSEGVAVSAQAKERAENFRQLADSRVERRTGGVRSAPEAQMQ
jgi:acetyl-CoA acetyltransferase